VELETGTYECEWLNPPEKKGAESGSVTASDGAALTRPLATRIAALHSRARILVRRTWLSLIIAINVLLFSAASSAGLFRERWTDDTWLMEQWVAMKFLDKAETEMPRATLTVLANKDAFP
jgi:hypothetical protein